MTRARVGSILICAAVVLAAWACWLGVTLPAPPQDWSAAGARPDNWRLTWVGLDALEVAGLLATGIALRRRHWSATVSALVALPLFVLDAWFDVMTAATSSQLHQALAMALLVELPTAAVLAWAARSGIRTLRAAARDERSPTPAHLTSPRLHTEVVRRHGSTDPRRGRGGQSVGPTGRHSSAA